MVFDLEKLYFPFNHKTGFVILWNFEFFEKRTQIYYIHQGILLLNLAKID